MPLSLEEKVWLLSMVDVFEMLPKGELEELAHLALDRSYEPGEALSEPQEGEGKLYVLKEGRVQLYVRLPDEGEVTLSVVEGGNMFGQMALTGQQLSGVYARAMTPSVICSLTRRDLERVILNHPEVGLRLVRHLSRQLREAERQMAELIHKGVPARLASLILRLVDREGVMTKEGAMVPSRYTHERLGTMIGAKRVAVTRAFNLLRQRGALEVKQRNMYIKDQEVLERIAGEGR